MSTTTSSCFACSDRYGVEPGGACEPCAEHMRVPGSPEPPFESRTQETAEFRSMTDLSIEGWIEGSDADSPTRRSPTFRRKRLSYRREQSQAAANQSHISYHHQVTNSVGRPGTPTRRRTDRNSEEQQLYQQRRTDYHQTLALYRQLPPHMTRLEAKGRLREHDTGGSDLDDISASESEEYRKEHPNAPESPYERRKRGKKAEGDETDNEGMHAFFRQGRS